jgi:hypothetical protein
LDRWRPACEIDRLLAGPDYVDRDATFAPPGPQADDRCHRSEQTRRANLARLRQIRRRAYEDLMSTLAWVRELVSMIQLAKFTGAPASRASELVAQIAAAVEGISAITRQDAQPGAASASHDTVPCRAHPQRGDYPMQIFRRVGDIIAANLNDLVAWENFARTFRLTRTPRPYRASGPGAWRPIWQKSGNGSREPQSPRDREPASSTTQTAIGVITTLSGFRGSGRTRISPARIARRIVART